MKSLLAETNYYNSLNAKSTSNGSGKSKGNTPPESWARISTSQKPGGIKLSSVRFDPYIIYTYIFRDSS